MKRPHCDRHLQVYMFDLMYVNTKAIADEEYITATNRFWKLQENVKYSPSTKTLAYIWWHTFIRLLVRSELWWNINEM